jgi:hypothetical protein
MNLNPVATIVGAVGGIIDSVYTSDKERMDAQIELAKIDASLLTAQMDVNKAEASHASIWVAGARPAILWIGAAAMAWTFVLHPMLVWCWALMQAKGWIPQGMPNPPTLQSDELWVIISGILGIGGYRTFEKVKGVATN